MMSNLHELIPGAEPLAALRAQRVRAVRGALRRCSEVQRLAVDVLRRHGRQPHSDRDRARRRLRRSSATPRSRRCASRWSRCASSTTAARPTERYPSTRTARRAGITGLTTADGRVTILMPHPERVFRTVQHVLASREWGEDGPWMRMFRNARQWVASS